MDWVAFLTDHDIPYVTRGPNVRRDNLAIRCPFAVKMILVNIYL